MEKPNGAEEVVVKDFGSDSIFDAVAMANIFMDNYSQEANALTDKGKDELVLYFDSVKEDERYNVFAELLSMLDDMGIEHGLDKDDIWHS